MKALHDKRKQRWDIFCRVVDNFGDIAVSWRLARQLAHEHGIAVRLWVDQPAVLHALCPTVDVRAARQTVDGVAVALCDDAADVTPADVVIEAFGCGLPPRYLQAMAAMAERGNKPLWIVLEYLSAEPWVREHHGLPSPHPQLNIPRYFFFPGFEAGTGGVLCEADLAARRDAFDARAWWQAHGFDAVPAGALAVSLFAYAHAPLETLLDVCAEGAMPVVMAVPAGPLAQRARAHVAGGVRRGNLELRLLPFLPQAEYDKLLWACDVNFVRGEDSFVRAQWAGQPYVWHIYAQPEDAHRVKLDAFLARYTALLDAPAACAVCDFWQAWNGVAQAPPLAEAWQTFCGERATQRQGLARWQVGLAQAGDLAGNLLKFCAKMI